MTRAYRPRVHPTYACNVNAALEYPVKDPLRLLACAVIARWAEDVQHEPGEEIGVEWAELAEVPADWLRVGAA